MATDELSTNEICVEADVMMIYAYLVTFKDCYEPPLQTISLKQLEDAINTKNDTLSNLVTHLLIPFTENTSRKPTIKNFIYVLRRVINDFSFYIDIPNPIKIKSSNDDDLTTALNPLQLLDRQTIVSILTWLVNWTLDESKQVKQKIDEALKTEGRKSNLVNFVNVGVDRNGARVYQVGLETRIFLYKSGVFKQLTSGIDELETYCSNLWPMGPEWHLLQHLRDKVLVPAKEMQRIENIERLKREEEQRLEKLAKEEEERLAQIAAENKERKRLDQLEKQRLFELYGPRKSLRSKNNVSYVVDSDSSEFEAVSSNDDEITIESEETGKRKTRKVIECEEEVTEDSCEISDEESLAENTRRSKRPKAPVKRTSDRLSSRTLGQIQLQ